MVGFFTLSVFTSWFMLDASFEVANDSKASLFVHKRLCKIDLWQSLQALYKVQFAR